MKKRIVNTTSVFPPGYPSEDAVDRLARLGFEALDMALDYCNYEGSPFLSDAYLDWAKALKARALRLGVPFTHAHSPADVSSFDMNVRALRTSGALGCRFLVIHPVVKEDGQVIQDAARFIDLNAARVKPLLPVAEETGVIILSENLMGGASGDPRIIARLVERVNSPFFGWCYDTGHANIMGHAADIVTRCACAPRSLHLQDNHGSWDDHLIPGEGDIDWAVLTKALRDVGYSGDCVLEAHEQSLEAPDEERDAILERLLKAAIPLREQLG